MNAGRVELDLVAVGKDQVSAMLRQVDAQVKRTASEMRTLGEQAGATAPKLTSLAPSAAEVTKKLSGMSMAIIGGVVGAAGSGVIGAITSLAGEVVDLVAEFLKSEPRIDSFSEQLIATANDAAKMTAQLTNIGTAAAEASKQVEGFGQRVNTLAARIARMRGQGDLADVYERAAEVAGTGDAIKKIEENMGKAETAANEAARTVNDLRPKLEKARLDVIAAQEAIKLREAQGLGDGVQRQQLILATTALAGLAANVTMTEVAYTDASGAVRKMAEELSYLDTLQAEQGKTQKAEAEKVTKTVRGGSARTPGDVNDGIFKPIDTSVLFTSGFGDGDIVAPMTGEITRMATETEKAAAAFKMLGDATGDLDVKLPGLSGAFAQISAIWEKTTDSAESLAGGVLGSVNAIATAGAAWIKDEKQRTRFLGLKNILLSAPMAFVDPAQAAAMFATGVGLVALAGGGGGGGGSKGGGSRSSGGGSSAGSGSSGGPTTIVNNFAMGIGDRQTITLALRQSERTSRGTGASSRGGV